MIERYSISNTSSQLAERFNIEVDPKFKPRYNASATQLMPVITQSGRGGLSYFHWGQTPAMAKNKAVSSKLLFADAEDLLIKSNLKRKMQSHRCIIPADGFYAWKKVGKKELIPYRIVALDQHLFSVAGLWEEFEDESGDDIHTFTMIYTPSPKVISDITESFPAILNQEQESVWLDPDVDPASLPRMLAPYNEDQLSFFTVSSRIHSAKVDSPDLMKPAPASDQFGNYSLFD